jgi:alanine racemase
MWRRLSRNRRRVGYGRRVHLKIETGTNRQGIALNELPAFVSDLAKLQGIEVEGAYTHFANIEDTLDPSFAESQLRKFKEGLAILERAGLRLTHIHASATAGSLLYPEMDFTMIRLGIGTYGIWPSRETQLAARGAKALDLARARVENAGCPDQGCKGRRLSGTG